MASPPPMLTHTPIKVMTLEWSKSFIFRISSVMLCTSLTVKRPVERKTSSRCIMCGLPSSNTWMLPEKLTIITDTHTGSSQNVNFQNVNSQNVNSAYICLTGNDRL